MPRPPPSSTLFPYTTLFRSEPRAGLFERVVVILDATDSERREAGKAIKAGGNDNRWLHVDGHEFLLGVSATRSLHLVGETLSISMHIVCQSASYIRMVAHGLNLNLAFSTREDTAAGGFEWIRLC